MKYFLGIKANNMKYYFKKENNTSIVNKCNKCFYYRYICLNSKS